ncbi:MAG: class I SAM-dependent methyltransferase [Proteobacteria bacterium]|nr:class I SAM-dependent methyltransferase [Pseudomonadota bacterium]
MDTNNTIRDDTGKRHRHKYENPNIIHQLVLGRFIDSVAKEIKSLPRSRTLDFGCGEGFFLRELKQRGVYFDDFLGIDLREDALTDAKTLLPEYSFKRADLLTWNHPEHYFDLVIASQVLEHLPSPEVFLKKLIRLTNQYLLLTVPWEPWFRLTNLLRGRDLSRLGNHPEHINHWGVSRFTKFLEAHATIVKLYTVFPFIIAVVKRPGSE